MIIYLLTVTIGSLHMLTTRITAYTCISSSRLWEVLFARGGVVWRPYFLSFLIDWKTEPSFYKHEAFCKNLEGQPCLACRPRSPLYCKASSTVQTETSLDLELVIRQSIVWVKASNGAKFKIKRNVQKFNPHTNPLNNIHSFQKRKPRCSIKVPCYSLAPPQICTVCMYEYDSTRLCV